MARIWRGIVNEYRNFLPSEITNTVVTLGEGGYPLIAAPKIAKLLEKTAGLDSESINLYVKFEGRNPTGSFKDRGMTAAISAEKGRGTKAVVCASTGNTSASAAAYAAVADMQSVVLVPDGKIAMGKLAQAIAHGAKILQVDGNFDDCLLLARDLSDKYPVGLVNSVNPYRIEGQKTGAFEVVDELGNAPLIHALPVGNAGNITAYWKGYKEYQETGISTNLPQMWGFQAEGAAPIVRGAKVDHPETIATAIRIGNPASWKSAESARDESSGMIDMVSDQEILHAHRLLSANAGVFVEPASAAGLAGLLKKAGSGELREAFETTRKSTADIVITCTGHGLKDPAWAINQLDGTPKGPEVEPIKISNSLAEIAKVLGL